MARLSKSTGTYIRSSDFPDIDDYTYDELREACKLYAELKRTTKGVINSCEIQRHFKCTPLKARMLLGAAEFHDKMKRKGMA